LLEFFVFFRRKRRERERREREEVERERERERESRLDKMSSLTFFNSFFRFLSRSLSLSLAITFLRVHASESKGSRAGAGSELGDAVGGDGDDEGREE
jgi:hypothetical protein